jgi:hypothetical protein
MKDKHGMKIFGGEPFLIDIVCDTHRPENLGVSANGQFAVPRIERPKNETVERSMHFK